MEETTTFNEQDIRKFYKFLDHINPTEVITFQPKLSWVDNEQAFLEVVKNYNQNEKVDVYAGFRDRLDKNDEGVTSSSGIWIEIDEHNSEKPEELPKLKKFCADNNLKIGLIGFSGGGSAIPNIICKSTGNKSITSTIYFLLKHALNTFLFN